MARWITAAGLCLGLFGAACDDPPACYPGEYEACLCGEGTEAVRGFRQCDDAARYGACICDGTVPGLEEGTGGLAAFLSPCSEDADCETGLCHPFNAKGPHCSSPCERDDDCPPPSTGCNLMGICKVP